MTIELPPDVYDAISLVQSMPDFDLAKDTKEIMHFFERHRSYHCAVDWILAHPQEYEAGITEGFRCADVLEPSAVQR
ncbi:MAG: hypothetical protein ACYTBJ_01670 [Planctomycetota bacterium]|jgi:hypothetical protein